MNSPICLGITGASGAIYAVRLLEVLVSSGRNVLLSISPSGRDVIHHELKIDVDLDRFDATALHKTGHGTAGKVQYYHYQDFMAPMASGSFLTGGMVICPCSGSTLSAVAAGSAGNLIARAAEVHLKERRKLILVPRETPLSLVHVKNFELLLQAGAIILPANPFFYMHPRTIEDVVDTVVARVLDHMGIGQKLVPRWQEEQE
jgi:4-hydroxy-3-polyprenylbenzoate decarboxylase